MIDFVSVLSIVRETETLGYNISNKSSKTSDFVLNTFLGGEEI